MGACHACRARANTLAGAARCDAGAIPSVAPPVAALRAASPRGVVRCGAVWCGGLWAQRLGFGGVSAMVFQHFVAVCETGLSTGELCGCSFSAGGHAGMSDAHFSIFERELIVGLNVFPNPVWYCSVFLCNLY